MADDISGQLGELCQQAFSEGDYDPAEDLVRDPFCRKVNEVCGVALNEIASMRESATKMHRRAQEAEALLPQWRQIAGLTYVKGSLGRALLAWGMTKAKEENDALRAENDAARDLLAVIHGDGGHYTHDLGFKRSCEDAEKKFHRQWEEADSLRASEAQAHADIDLMATLMRYPISDFPSKALADALSRAAARRAKKETTT